MLLSFAIPLTLALTGVAPAAPDSLILAEEFVNRFDFARGQTQVNKVANDFGEIERADPCAPHDLGHLVRAGFLLDQSNQRRGIECKIRR